MYQRLDLLRACIARAKLAQLRAQARVIGNMDVVREGHGDGESGNIGKV